MEKYGLDLIKIKSGYKIDTNVTDLDSVFVKGYVTNKKGEINYVTVTGFGVIINKNDYKDANLGENDKYFQQRSLKIKLSTNIALAGLSGSPAFNKQGKVIGVYSGRIVEEVNDVTTNYARVSLFN